MIVEHNGNVWARKPIGKYTPLKGGNRAMVVTYKDDKTNEVRVEMVCMACLQPFLNKNLYENPRLISMVPLTKSLAIKHFGHMDEYRCFRCPNVMIPSTDINVVKK
jgi:hypothetical protein